MPDNENLTSKVVRASFWTVATRWTMRSLGLVSLIVLARLLEPEDYGLMAMAMTFVALMNLFMTWGFEIAIVRHPDPQRDHYDTAWTLQFFNGLICSTVVFLMAPYIADFFDEPRLVEMLRIMSIGFIVIGLNNIGLADLQRNFQFSREFRYLVACRLTAFVVTIIAAYLLRSYWALVIGQLTATTVRLCFGYIVVPRRPRFTLSRSAEILSFSVWVVVRNFALFATKRFDTIVISRLYTAEMIGPYDLAKNVSRMAISESLHPLSRALLPGFSKITSEERRALAALGKALGIYATIALPLGLGLASVAEEFVNVVLGQKWAAAVPFVVLFAVGTSARFLLSPFGPFLLAQGKSRTVAALACTQALVFIGLVSYAAHAGDMVMIAACSAAVSVIVAPLYSRLGLGSWGAFGWMLRPMVRPLVAALVMVTAVLAVGTLPLSPVIMLAAKVSLGIVVYGGCLALLWLSAGRPEGPETVFLGVAASLRRRVSW